MRRLLAWGRQDPQCPAEAASPPPLSAFHSPWSSVLPPPPSKLFFDIERQLSARVAAEPLLHAAQQQPTPPIEAFSERSSPPESTPAVHSAATPAAAANNGALTAETAQVASIQQQQANATEHQQQQQPPKGIDAFFAALANASSSDNVAPSSVSYQRHFLELDQPNSRRNSFAQHSPIAARQSSELCAQQHSNVAHQLSTAQPLAQKIQQVANNALSANLFVNALAAQHQQQQLQYRHDGMLSTDSSMALLANINTSNQSTSSHLSPSAQLNSPLAHQRIDSQNSPNGLMALNAFHLVQQTANFNKQKILAEQQQRHTALKSTLNSQNGVFPGSEIGIPALLSRLSSVPSILRSVGPGPSHSKPIPLLNERVDLLQFKSKEPREWSSDDVVAWILDVARRHQIPCENLNLAKFANCTGPLLMLMNEHRFKEHDPIYGSLLFAEFCKLVTDENFIDEWVKVNGAVAGSSSAPNQPLLAQMDVKKAVMPTTFLQQTAFLGQLALQQEKRHQQGLLVESVTAAESPMDAAQSVAAGASTSLLLNAAVAAVNSQQNAMPLSSLNQLLLPAPPSTATEGILQYDKAKVSPLGQLQTPLISQPAIASLSRMIQPIQRQQQYDDASNHQNPSGTSNLMAAVRQQRSQQQHLLKPMTSEGIKRGVGRPAGSRNKVERQIKRNKDGRPRKRSQHTKGNKLWEFIKDALKDPRTCPSVVRWEDPAEGVFRIVESEQLAFLWGQKKNNQKMTYEKLSRAMRTYYEKEILVPVPKSGLYPKKLVYKFGPTAHGWRTAASVAVQANLALFRGPPVNI